MVQRLWRLSLLLLFLACDGADPTVPGLEDPGPPLGQEEEQEEDEEESQCGNGLLEPELGEECDEGEENTNLVPGACRLDCRWAASSAQATTAPAAVAGGHLMKSGRWRLITTVGQAPGGQARMTSPNYELRSGVAGTTQP